MFTYDELFTMYNTAIASDNLSTDELYEELRVIKEKTKESLKSLKKQYNRFDVKYFRFFEKNKLSNEIISLNSLIMSINASLNIYDSHTHSYAIESLSNSDMKNWGPCLKNEIDNNDCTICFNELDANDNIKHLGTNHYFHRSCLMEWYNSPTGQNKCPVCRQKFGKKINKTKINKKSLKKINKNENKNKKSLKKMKIK